ncbi:DEAD/DEAH box helicase [Desulfuromonas thiophila]|uniref:DEAD/DEAH box helicase n=1 Tax=Desulfuromonas thiophila TaxID=57664 RepID=UPI0024A89AD3|nr:DEAD/DEAH box helicase [Desulfuromonas thiophila]
MFSPEFAALGLNAALLQALYDLDYQHPSAIQQHSIPLLLEGRNLLGTAQTGTGKTAAYALPLLQRLESASDSRCPRILVLTPTRELAIQVAQAIEGFARHLPRTRTVALYGGSAMGLQLKQLHSGIEVVVGTPGRLLDHLQRGSLDLSQLQAVVLDEADEMLRMGFIDDVETLLAASPPDCQRALFSATMPPAIRRVAQRYLGDAEQVQIASPTSTVTLIEQSFVLLRPNQKFAVLCRLLESEDSDGIIVFVRTKNATTELAEQLEQAGYRAAPLSGDLSQSQREYTIERLKKGRLDIVVATDVAARGLDVERISHVFNYDIPFDTEAYIHRIGRTGRAGRSGRAILFVTPAEQRLLRAIEQATGRRIAALDIPDSDRISACRIERLRRQLQQTLAEQDLTALRRLMDALAQSEQIAPAELAAALVWQLQRDKPLFPDLPELEPASRRPERERPQRDGAAATTGRPRASRVSSPMQTYRIALGRQQRIGPADIVGAFSNEGRLQREQIGQIRIGDASSEIDLAADLSPAALKRLHSIKIHQQTIDLQPVGAASQPAASRGGKARPVEKTSRPRKGADNKPAGPGNRSKPKPRKG